MKTKSILKAGGVIILLIVGNACTKPSTTTNTNTNTNTNPLATNGTIIHNGKTFPVKAINSFGKYNEKSYNLDIDLSTTDSNIHLLISSADYLPTTGTILNVNNIMPLAASKVSWVISYGQKISPYTYYQESSVLDKSGNTIITNANKENQFVTNNSQGYKMDASTGGKMSFNIKRMHPSIPTANAAFTPPTGMDPNTITLGANTWVHTADRHQINAESNGNCKAFVQNTSANTKELVFIFKDGLPVSGTYDIVTTEGAVTDGKVFVKHTTLTPLAVWTSTDVTQKIVVENNNGVVKIYAKNINLATEVLNAYIIF
jgi:hypothetical protein